jgi:hypothetical protein
MESPDTPERFSQRISRYEIFRATRTANHHPTRAHGRNSRSSPRSSIRAAHHQHRPHRFLSGAAPLKPLTEPVDLGQHRVRTKTRISGLINEYHLVA